MMPDGTKPLPESRLTQIYVASLGHSELTHQNYGTGDGRGGSCRDVVLHILPGSVDDLRNLHRVQGKNRWVSNYLWGVSINPCHAEMI